MSDWGHNYDAEAATLAVIMLDSEDAKVIFRLLDENDFTESFHGLVFLAMKRLHRAGLEIDLLTVMNEMRDRGELDLPGRLTRLTGLASAVPTNANGEYYARIVLCKTLRRKMDLIGNELVLAAHDDSVEIGPVLNATRDSLSDLLARTHA